VIILQQAFLHLKSLWTNIGNAFIDYGTIILWQKVLGEKIDDPLSRMSLPPEFILTTVDRVKMASSFLPCRVLNKIRLLIHDPEAHVLQNYSCFIPEYINNTEYVSVAGMILTKRFLMIYKPILEKLKQKGKKLVFIGVGGSKYDRIEVEESSKILARLRPYALIAREEKAYKNYSKYFKYSYLGIDNAFFLREKFLKQNNKKKYIILVFDSTKIPKELLKNLLNEEDPENIVRSFHSFYASIKPGKVLEERSFKIMVSDNPLDYIRLYASSKKIYSDRVHACIAGITLGSKCMIYGKMDKRFLAIERAAVKEEFYAIDGERYMRERDNEIKFLREIIKI